MPWVGFEPKIPAFERAKRVHALDRAATVIGFLKDYEIYILEVGDDGTIILNWLEYLRQDEKLVVSETLF
jgi:hypothetical protein